MHNNNVELHITMKCVQIEFYTGNVFTNFLISLFAAHTVWQALIVNGALFQAFIQKRGILIL